MKKKDEIKLSGFYKVKVFCENRIPDDRKEELEDKVKIQYEIKGNSITIREDRANWTGNGKWIICPIAKIKFNVGNENWSIYWRDQHSKWHLYERLPPKKQIEEIIQEISVDPTGIFWG
jgi:hypothetical protein